MSDKHRDQLHARMGAFGVKMRTIQSDERMLEVARVMFQVDAATIDDVWRASVALGRKERSRRARSARANRSISRHYTTVDWDAAKAGHPWSDDDAALDADREERVMIAKARASVSIMAADDPRRRAVELFLRRQRWA